MPIPPFVARLREHIGHDLLLLTGVNAVVLNEHGEILLQKRADEEGWGIPGGIVEPEESILNAVVREVKEETGADIRIERVTGIYSDPKKNLHTYPNGDRTRTIIITFLCHYLGGELKCVDGEALEVCFVHASQLPDGFIERHRLCITDALNPDNDIRVT